MANQESKVYNGYETTLAASFAALAASFEVVAPGSVAALTYLVIEPDDPAQREVLMVGTVVGSVFSNLSRYLAGSAAGSGLAHPSGSVVRSVAVQQMWEDAHDRIDNYSSHANLTNLGAGNPHPQYVLETLVDTRGDLLVGSEADALAILAAGADGSILTADSSETLGVSWVAPVAFSGCQVFNPVAQTAVAGVNQLLTWPSESFDTDGYHAAGTPTRLTAPADGYYEVSFKLLFAGDVSGLAGNAPRIALLTLNGTDPSVTSYLAVLGNVVPNCVVSQSLDGSIVMALTAGDYVQLYGQGPTGAQSQQVAGADLASSHFGIRRL